MRRWLATQFRRLAHWLDPEGSPRYSGASFTIGRAGVTFHRDETGCSLWYYPSDYHRAYDEPDG